MKTYRHYIITPNTMMIAGKYVCEKTYYSEVVETNESLIVTMNPKTFIDSNLKHYSGCLKGATETSREILGNIRMVPIMVCKELDIYLLPCCSPERNDCIWLAVNHIARSEKHGHDGTIVHFKNGQSVVMNMKKERFDRKMHRALQLRYILRERTKKMA